MGKSPLPGARESPDLPRRRQGPVRRGVAAPLPISVAQRGAPAASSRETPLVAVLLISLALNVAPRSGPVKAVAAEPVASKADFAYGLPVRRRHARSVAELSSSRCGGADADADADGAAAAVAF